MTTAIIILVTMAIMLSIAVIGIAYAEMVDEEITEMPWMKSIDRDFVCENGDKMNLLMIFTNKNIFVGVVASFTDGSEDLVISELYSHEEYAEKEEKILIFQQAWTQC